MALVKKTKALERVVRCCFLFFNFLEDVVRVEQAAQILFGKARHSGKVKAMQNEHGMEIKEACFPHTYCMSAYWVLEKGEAC